MQIDRVIAKGQLVNFVFGQTDVAAGQTAVALSPMAIRDTTANASYKNDALGYTQAFDFEIVSISVNASAARTAGTLTVDATIDGTVTGLQATLNAATTNNAKATAPRRQYRGSAGSYIGCKISTPSWTPTTADIVVTVQAIVFLDGI